jgi:hypothetical protein
MPKRSTALRKIEETTLEEASITTAEVALLTAPHMLARTADRQHQTGPPSWSLLETRSTRGWGPQLHTS